MYRYLILSIIAVLLLGFAYYNYEKNTPIVILHPDNTPTKIKPKTDTNHTATYADNRIYDALLIGKARKKKSYITNSSPQEVEQPVVLGSWDGMDDIFDDILPSSEQSSGAQNINDHLLIVNIDNTYTDLDDSINLKTSDNQYYLIELGCVKNQESANLIWGQMQNKYPKILSSAQMSLEKMQKSEDRFYFLILAGPYTSVSAANTICKKLTSQGQYCIVHPN
jgi:SPOR domain